MTQELDAIRAEVEMALGLTTSEIADALIGDPQPDEYGTLIRGVRGVYQMLWMMVKGSGFQGHPNSIRMGAQALTMLLTIVHYAYALGIKQGHENGRQVAMMSATSAIPIPTCLRKKADR